MNTSPTNAVTPRPAALTALRSRLLNSTSIGALAIGVSFIDLYRQPVMAPRGASAAGK